MDDFNIQTMRESKNEYISLFINKVSPLIMQGIYSVFKEAKELCIENDEEEKYLMTFQNFLGRTPKWNNEIVQNETNRIVKDSGCNYLEDLLTCVHICELKILTNIRVGIKQKKISLHIPKLSDFIHKVYIQLARKLYKNVFLFELNIPPLQRQKNLREFELICKEAVLETIVESMPIEEILKAYLDETIEEYADETKEEIKEVEEEVDDDTVTGDDKVIGEQKENETRHDIHIQTQNEQQDSSYTNIQNNETHSQIEGTGQSSEINIPSNDTHRKESQNITIKTNTPETNVSQKEERGLQFNDEDKVKSFETNDIPNALQKTNEQTNFVSKEPEYLEQISNEKHEKRKLEEDSDGEDDYSDDEKLVINDNPISLDYSDIHDLNVDSNVDIDLGIEEL